jgi:DNA-binding GntR family transcriptional regulator
MLHAKNIAIELAELLGDRIIRMEYQPGERIIETRIASVMGVSQGPVREALRILQQNGLVEIIPRRGTYVTSLSRDDIQILYDMLAGLYRVLIRHFVAVITEEDQRQIRLIVDRLQTAAEQADPEMYYTNMFAFANVAIASLGNPLLKKTIHDLWFSKRRIEYRMITARRNDLMDNIGYFHRMEAHIRDGDAGKTMAVLMDYLANEKVAALRFFDHPQEASTSA